MITGKQEHAKAAIDKMTRILSGQPEYVKSFYYFIRNGGKTKSYRTHEEYVKYIIAFLNYVDKDINDITMDDYSEYISVISMKKDGTEASGSYLVAVYSALNKFFKYMYDSRKIKYNPMSGTERPAPKPYDQIERTYLTKSEIKKCFKYIENETKNKFRSRDKAILDIFLATAIRCSALTEINIENIDFENNILRVVDKGNKAKEFYLSDKIIEDIRMWLIVREEIMNNSNNNTNALFVSSRKNRMSQRMVAYVIDDICSNVVGRHISPHKLRATSASNAIKSGLTVYQVQQLLGHASPVTTERCYIQGQDEELIEAQKKAMKGLNLY